MKKQGCKPGEIFHKGTCLRVKGINEFNDKGEFIQYAHNLQRKVPHPWVPGSYTCRPYIVGMGCDGSTDANIHYVAQKMMNALGVNYGELYLSAYPDILRYKEKKEILANKSKSGNYDEAQKTRKVDKTTIIPSSSTIQNVLDDLYDINNRTLVEKIEEKLDGMGIPLDTPLTRLHGWKQ